MRGLALIAAILVAGAAVPQPAAAQADASTAVDQSKLALAKEWFGRMQSGDVDHSQLNDNGNMSLDADTVKGISAEIGPLGAPVAFVQQSIAPQNGNTACSYLLTFKSGAKIAFVLLLDGSGKIAGISVQPG